MVSIRSAEGRSGALQAAAAKKIMGPMPSKNQDKNAGTITSKSQLAEQAKKGMGPAPITSKAEFAEKAGKSPGMTAAEAQARNAGRDIAQAVPKTATQTAQRTAVSIPAKNTGGSSAGSSSSGGGSYKAPTATSSNAGSTTSSTSSTKPKVAVVDNFGDTTTSGGTSGSVDTSRSSGGAGKALGRGNRKTNRNNPRAARSTSIDELKKQAARQLGI